VPIEIDTTEAPALLRCRCFGVLPTPEEQETLRADLIDRGLLTDGSVSLLDFRKVDTPDAVTIVKSIAAAGGGGMARLPDQSRQASPHTAAVPGGVTVDVDGGVHRRT
jgi:hypothetical protein